MAALTALFDACVLYPAPLRDLLMHLASTGLFRARWTDMIHEEWIGNLLKNRTDLTRARLERTRALMNAAVPDCLVTGFEPLIETLNLPDPDDRHVLAAAIVGGADLIVTSNLKDFPPDLLAPFGIEPTHPDDFVVNQFDWSPAVVCGAVKRHRESLRKRPKTVEQYLATLSALQMSQTVQRLRECAAPL
jgi:hypothetical protein